MLGAWPTTATSRHI